MKKALEKVAAIIQARSNAERIHWNLSSDDNNNHLVKAEIYADLAQDIREVANGL